MSEQDLQRQIDALTAQLERLRATDAPKYVESTWTPGFAGTGTAGTFTYVNQQGTYTRIGNRVLLTGRLTISNITVAPTGTMKITGLPFTVATAYAPFSFGGIDNLVYPAGALQILAIAIIGQTYASIQYSVTNAPGVGYPAASFTNNSTDLVFSCQYQV